MSFLKNLRISSKVYGGFGIVLLLLLAIALTATINLSDGNDQFQRYRKIARQANQAGRVQANLLEARLAVKNFIISATPESIAEVKERAAKTLELNRELEEMVASPEKKALIEKADAELNQYVEAFDKVTGLQATREDLVANTLDQVGPEMEKKLTTIMESANADLDATATHRAGMVLRNLLLMRLYATKFLVTNDDAAYERVLAESAAMSKSLDLLMSELQNPTRRGLATEIGKLHESYETTFKAVHDAIDARNTLIAEKLDVIGPTIANEMEDLKLSIKEEQDKLGPVASAAMENAVYVATVVSALSVIFGLFAAWSIGRGISRPIQTITAAMKTLAGGDKSQTIPGQDHKDEIGDMAAAVQVFKENMIKADEAAEREAAEAEARQIRTRRIEKLAHDFDVGVSALLAAVSGASSEMEDNASMMSGIANDTSHRATTVASAAEEASTNVQTVAAATEELTGSIHEISRQVSKSAEIAGRAVAQAEKTDGQVRGLAEAAQQIGEVVSLISAIAEQTNLLALNATIEAARAGEMGKGFAVVAAEVKGLANQTAKATDEIGKQIADIQSETLEAVSAIQTIGTIIKEVNSIAAGIASAVEEQSAATGEIARNVEQASIGTQEVSANIVEVTRAAASTGDAASKVTAVAGDLSSKAEQLKGQVERFLNDVRAA